MADDDIPIEDVTEDDSETVTIWVSNLFDIFIVYVLMLSA